MFIGESSHYPEFWIRVHMICSGQSLQREKGQEVFNSTTSMSVRIYSTRQLLLLNVILLS